MADEEKVEQEVLNMSIEALEDDFFDDQSKLYILLRLLIQGALSRDEAETMLLNNSYINMETVEFMDELVYEYLKDKIDCLIPV